jgi:glycerophosphoryl diester phosphodiesterase
MRPLTKIKPPASQFTHDIHNVMISALGDFCNICERKLYDVALVWNRKNGALEFGVVSGRQWKELLILCHNCADNYAKDKKDATQLLLPDEALTFTLNNSSPFVYELKKTTTHYTDENGSIIEEAQGESVIVSGNTPEAQATIQAFALNTPYYNDSAAAFTIPMVMYLSLEDRRVEERTKAWNNASAIAAVLKQFSTDDALQTQALIINIRHQLLATGFWSTWITALSASGLSLDTIKAVLGIEPAPGPSAKKIAVKKVSKKIQSDTKGPGNHNPMPGTNDQWMQ